MWFNITVYEYQTAMNRESNAIPLFSEKAAFGCKSPKET